MFCFFSRFRQEIVKKVFSVFSRCSNNKITGFLNRADEIPIGLKIDNVMHETF